MRVLKHEGLLAETEIDFRRVLLLKPETFMNLSGRSVGQAVRFHKIELTDVLVVCDEPGIWAFHCHILTHAESADGMFGMVTVLVVQA